MITEFTDRFEDNKILAIVILLLRLLAMAFTVWLTVSAFSLAMFSGAPHVAIAIALFGFCMTLIVTSF